MHHGFNQLKYFKYLLIYNNKATCLHLCRNLSLSNSCHHNSEYILEKCMRKTHRITEEKKNKRDGKTYKRYLV